MKAIETTGTVDEQHQLRLDRPLPVEESGRVRVIVLLPENGDLDEPSWLAAAAGNPAFDFLKEPAEDVYSLTDGHPPVNGHVLDEYREQM